MANKPFGHVGDVITATIQVGEIPRFDQSHVDYLKRTFLTDRTCEAATNQDDLVRVASWVAMDNAQRHLIAHIETLIANQKGAV